MTIKTYIGQIQLQDPGEAYDILFLSSLENPLAEELEWMHGQTVTVRYWITDKECTKEEAAEEVMMTALGSAEAKYGARYSEVTGYLWTDEDLKVGGHDLMAEFHRHVGQWLILEVSTDE